MLILLTCNHSYFVGMKGGMGGGMMGGMMGGGMGGGMGGMGGGMGGMGGGMGGGKRSKLKFVFFSMITFFFSELRLVAFDLFTNYHNNTVVSNHFHSVKILLFSSARSRDLDGTPGTEFPVSMYTTKTPMDMCRLTFDLQF